MSTKLEFTPSSFLFDFVRWNKVYEDSSGRIRYGIESDGYPGIHPLFKDPVGYMEKLCKNNGFCMWLGYVEECYVWDITPIVLIKKSDENDTIEHAEVYIEAYRLDPTCMNCEILDNGRHASIEFNLPRTPDIAKSVRVDKSGNEKENHIYIHRGKLRYFGGKDNPMFSRLEGNLCLYSDAIADFASIHSENIVNSLKYNIISYIAMKMSVNEEFRFTSSMKDPVNWTILIKAESYNRDRKPFGTSGYVFVSFIMMYSITTDGFKILPFAEYYGDHPKFQFIAPNPNLELNPFSCIYFYMPETFALQQEDMANVYLSMRFSNFKIPKDKNTFVIPYTFHHLDTEYDCVHSDSPSDCHAAFFNEQTSSLIFGDSDDFKETQYHQIMNAMDTCAAQNKKYYIPDLHIRVMKKSAKRKGIMDFLFHKEDPSKLIRDDFYIMNPKYQEAFRTIVKISDYKIPAFKNPDELYGYMHLIKNDIKCILYDHPTWDYIPLQGFDILMAKNDLPYTSNSPEECLAKMILNKEITRYSILWGDISASGIEVDRKQIHNQPVFPSGGRCLWIFA